MIHRMCPDCGTDITIKPTAAQGSATCPLTSCGREYRWSLLEGERLYPVTPYPPEFTPPPDATRERVLGGADPKVEAAANKDRLDLIPRAALDACAENMALGVTKYGLKSWREGGNGQRLYAGAALRHITAYLDGQDQTEDDTDSLGAAMASLAILIDGRETGVLEDDR